MIVNNCCLPERAAPKTLKSAENPELGPEIGRLGRPKTRNGRPRFALPNPMYWKNPNSHPHFLYVGRGLRGMYYVSMIDEEDTHSQCCTCLFYSIVGQVLHKYFFYP